MKKTVLIILFLLSCCNLSFAQDCIKPAAIKSWDYHSSKAISSNKDWKNDVDTDYWQLSLSWSKGYCDQIKGNISKKHWHQCLNNKFGLVVHGLWAQSKNAGNNYKKHPRNCVDAKAIDANLIAQYICIIPGIQLMQKEWEKHGTCDFNTPEEYFATLNVLFQQLNIPSRKEMEFWEYETSEKIKAFFADYNKRIGLTKKSIKIKMKKKRLSEIYVVYDKDFNFANPADL